MLCSHSLVVLSTELVVTVGRAVCDEFVLKFCMPSYMVQQACP